MSQLGINFLEVGDRRHAAGLERFHGDDIFDAGAHGVTGEALGVGDDDADPRRRRRLDAARGSRRRRCRRAPACRFRGKRRPCGVRSADAKCRCCASALATRFSMTWPMCCTSRRVPWKALLAVTGAQHLADRLNSASRAASALSTTRAAAPMPMIMPWRRRSKGMAASSTTSSVAAAPLARKPAPIHSIR